MRLKTSPKPLCFDIAFSVRSSAARLLGAGCVILSSGSFALGLGDLHTSTYLGQYLEAKVSFVDGGRSYQASELSVRQVLSKEAKSLGIDLVNSNYLFLLELTGEGETLGLRVRSRGPITEPYVNFLVRLEWAGGSVYREYTLFLDPPPEISEALGSLSAIAQERNGVSNRSEGSSLGTKATTVVARKSNSQKGAGVSNNNQSEPQVPLTDERELTHYRIRGGDTLSKIAEQWRQGTEETIRSTSLWLFENNPDSFSAGSKHQLIAGSLLRLPKRSELPLAGRSPAVLAGADRVEKDLINTEPLSDDSAQGRLRLAEANNTPLTDAATASRARLTADLDTNKELIDRLRRENNDLRGRLSKLEGSDYVQMLTRLIELQNLQIDRLREEASGKPSDSVQPLVAGLSPGVPPAFVTPTASAEIPELITALATSVPDTSLVVTDADSKTGLIINTAEAAVLSSDVSGQQNPVVRAWWEMILLAGLPLLAVGLYFLAWLRVRLRPESDLSQEVGFEQVVGVYHWQPDAGDETDVLWSASVAAGELDEDVSFVDTSIPSVSNPGADLDKPLLLLDEVLEREFEALVEATDFDPACEFPDLDEDLFSQSLVGTENTPDASGVVRDNSDVGISSESEALQAAIVAAAGEEGASIRDAKAEGAEGGSLESPSPFNDSFEGLGGACEKPVLPQGLDGLPGIDQDFGLNDAVRSAAVQETLNDTSSESTFELSHDQQTEFEEDWLGSSSLGNVSSSARSTEPADDKAVSSEAEVAPLHRRRDDLGRVDVSQPEVAKVLPFQRRRSDEEVKQSILAKTSDYTPPDEAYVVCDCDDDTVLSLDFDLIDDPEFGQQGLNVEGFENEGVGSADAVGSDAPVTAEEVSGIVSAGETGSARNNGVYSQQMSQPLFVDLQFRAGAGDDGASQRAPH